ncbi:hypothetical protein LINGRAHAP2_LOCUS16629 [Linum grandiflorum]
MQLSMSVKVIPCSRLADYRFATLLTFRHRHLSYSCRLFDGREIEQPMLWHN